MNRTIEVGTLEYNIIPKKKSNSFQNMSTGALTQLAAVGSQDLEIGLEQAAADSQESIGIAN